MALETTLHGEVLPACVRIAVACAADVGIFDAALRFFTNVVMLGSDMLDIILSNADFLPLLESVADQGGPDLQKSVYWLFWAMLYVATTAQLRAVLPTVTQFVADAFLTDDPGLLETIVIGSGKLLSRLANRAWASDRGLLDAVIAEIAPRLCELEFSATPALADKIRAIKRRHPSEFAEDE
jgi:hypothetical protein